MQTQQRVNTKNTQRSSAQGQMGNRWAHKMVCIIFTLLNSTQPISAKGNGGLSQERGVGAEFAQFDAKAHRDFNTQFTRIYHRKQKFSSLTH
jgi:hypothetical protein